MEEQAFMVCVRVEELDDPVEGSTTTACVECGSDIWISAESRKEAGKIGAMPLCTKCAGAMAKDYPSLEHVSPSDGQFAELAAELEKEAAAIAASRVEGMDSFEALKMTARLAGKAMVHPNDDWGSMIIMENFDGVTFPPVPMSKMLEAGIPTEVIAKQLIPGLVHASQARRVLFGISSWTLTGAKDEGMPDVEGPISEHPERKEMLVLLDVTADGVQQMAAAEIIRDGVSVPVLGEWEDSADPSASDGLFVEALVPALGLVRSLREGSSV